jgi:serralysin
VPHGTRPSTIAIPPFDTLGYLGANPDVAAAGVNPLDHFLSFGAQEGRMAVNDGLSQ